MTNTTSHRLLFRERGDKAQGGGRGEGGGKIILCIITKPSLFILMGKPYRQPPIRSNGIIRTRVKRRGPNPLIMSRKLQHNQQHLMGFSLLEKGALQPIAITLACFATARADFIDEIADNADSSCAAGEATGDYDTSLHVASVFVLLVASGLDVFYL